MTSRAETPRKPRWERKAGERPEALFHAALQAFAQHGYRATRLEDVAAEAGVSKGTVYRYFRGKDDLLEKSLEHRRKLLFSATAAALEEFRGSAASKLEFFLGRAWSKCHDENWGRFHKLMYGEIAHELPDLFASWARQGQVRAWKLLEGIIRAGQRAGEFRADADARAIARLLYSGLTHQALLRSHLGFARFDPLPPDSIFKSSLELALRGLALPPTPRKASKP